MGLVRSRRAALMCGVALGMVVAQGAAAQQNVNATNITLLERLVIGLGMPKVAIDTPQAVTVVNQADIDQIQATTTGEIFKSVPGVTIVGSERQFGEAFNIRGIGTTENSSDGSRVVVNVDGTPKFNEQYRMGSFFSDPELYKQVEVLRGPASSTLYGAGALGGVINFTTKDASDFIKDGYTGALNVKTGFSSNGLGTLTSAVLAQQISDTFEVLAAGNWRRQEDLTQAKGTTLPGSGFDTLSGLIKGTALIGEQKLTASYQHWTSDAKDQAYAQTSTQAAFGVTDRAVLDQTAVLRWENPATDNPWVDLNVQLSYSNTTNNQTNHRYALGAPRTVIGSNLPNLGVVTPDGQLGILLDTTYGYKTWQLQADNTVEWIGEDFENYFTFGAQGSTQDRTAVRPGTSITLPAHPQGTENKLGIFAQNEFVWNDKLTLIAGARSDSHWVTSTNGFASAADTAFSPKLSALYQIDDTFGVFGSVAHTERLPTIDELYSVALPSARSAAKTTSLNLRKEQANTVEGGLTISTQDLFSSGDVASVKTTAFYSDLTDLIVSNTALPAVPVTYYGNVGKARIYGLEIEGAYDNEWMYANLAYSATIGDNLVTNTPLTTVPQSKVVATLGFKHEEFGLNYGARVTLADLGRYFVPAATPQGQTADGPAEAVGTLDLFASWKPQTGPLAGTQIQGGIDNVFNADYRENLSSDRSTGRTFKISLSKQFDY
ncbi:TonB-dependent receptor domain-containing protein [Devosia rhizoryzae]|uniref:TonB-dependent receptor n=1 Tax=Devosia rhizoryzae TaxID=2774137 RepID=A0ABX7C1L1_9HYPH|nr:TonB-dependent receptor [Devosia rhizoryzae]QQR38078.1 TonB-dependent receptor [Devosia rhizoryzae]